MVIPDIEIFKAALIALDNLPTHRMTFRWLEGSIDELKDGLIDLIRTLNDLEEED